MSESKPFVGQKVTANGYPGTITRVCEWSDSMVEVRLASGTVCVDFNGTDCAPQGPSAHSHGSYGTPCNACGVQLRGEGLPSVNLRRGVPFSYCPECLTEQHRDRLEEARALANDNTHWLYDHELQGLLQWLVAEVDRLHD